MDTKAALNTDVAAIHAAMREEASGASLHGNPMAVTLGAKIVEARADFVALEFEPSHHLLQGAGVLQGGAVTAMLDFAMAFATLTGMPTDGTCGTVSLNVSFLRPAEAGHYRAEGRVDRRSKTMAFTNARLWVEGSEALVATATSVLAVRAR
ncbi:PaaI family thioesterase [Paraburkholderia sp. HP33-1]|uniref:PaaI family thioesterase n=1 Tax=Paraburkholderia sp. HP33-1 TaxID=2883243 RepID=UPI001F42CA18|nr:PaaI family thioesterase [Paraburkholderia sp. HP33-1]